MTRQIEPIPAPYPDHAHSIHYLRIGNTALYKPYTDNKGIHCAGDRFGYIVDWQITEQKGDHSMLNKTPH
jgi:hypothetical protein